MNQNKTFRILEIFWLSLAIFGIGMAIYLLIINDDYKMVLYCLGISVISGFKYVWRKRQRIMSKPRDKK